MVCQLYNMSYIQYVRRKKVSFVQTFAMRKPSEKSMISQICWRSGTMTTTGLKRAFTLSGSSVLPA